MQNGQLSMVTRVALPFSVPWLHATTELRMATEGVHPPRASGPYTGDTRTKREGSSQFKLGHDKTCPMDLTTTGAQAAYGQRPSAKGIFLPT